MSGGIPGGMMQQQHQQQQQGNDDQSWRTQNFRQNMVSKIEEAILQCGTPTSKNATEMESQVYSKANSKNEYLSFVARLILHIKEMGKPKGQQGVPGPGPGGNPMGGNPMGGNPMGGNSMGGNSMGGNPMGGNSMGGNPMGGNPMGGPINPMGAGTPQMMGQMSAINQMGQMTVMGGMNQPGHGQQQQQPMEQSGGGRGGMNIPQQPGGMGGMQGQGGMNIPQTGMMGQVGGMMGQQGGGMMGQHQVRMMSPGPGQQVSSGGMIGQQSGGMMVQTGGMNVNIGQQKGQQPNLQQIPIGQQNQNQMINQNFMNQQHMQQQMQNAGIGTQGQMQGTPGGMSQQQMQQQLQNQNPLILQQQAESQPQGVGRGMRMPMQQQMQQMPRKGLQPRPMNPTAMGIPRPEHGSSYPINRLNWSQQVDGVGMASQFPGGPQPPMARPSGPFMPPNSSHAGMPMGPGPVPSPNPMNVQGQTQSVFVNSPQPHSHGSPAPAGTIRPYGNQMVPSPSTNLNTPMPLAPTPSPRNIEELACMKKIEDLRRYTDMIQRMIVKIGNEDTEKSSKMKKLLDILSNPNRQVSMELLLKCEVALKKMEKQQHETGPPSQPTVPPKDQISPFLQIQEALLTTLKNGSSSHTFLRTFRPSIEALTGQTANCPDSSDDLEISALDEPKPLIPNVLVKELKHLGKRFPVTIQRRSEDSPLIIKANIGNPMLPRVPSLKLIIPVDYPDESPHLVDFDKDYRTTTFLRSVRQAFKSLKQRFPPKLSLVDFLIGWEMAVRQVTNPNSAKKKSMKIVRPTPPVGRLRLAFV